MKNVLKCFCFFSFFSFSLVTSVFAEAKVKLGVTLPLTGGLAEYGEAVRNGFLLAQKTEPKLFENLELIFEDDVYDSKKAVLNLRKFKQIDKVNLVFSFGVEPSLAIAPLAEREKLPFFTQSPVESLTKGRAYVVRFIYSLDKHGRVLTEYFKAQGIKRIAVLKSEISFFELISESIKRHLKKGQSYEVIDTVLPTEIDLKPLLLRTDFKKFDAVGVYLLPAQLRLFYKQLNQLDISIPTFGTTPFESTKVLQDVMPLLENIPYTHSATKLEFIQKYKAEYANDMHVGYAAGCYDFAMLLAKLVHSRAINATMKGSEVISAFAAVGTYRGMSGEMTYVDSPEFGKYFDSDISVKKFIKGEIITEFTLH